ncbi:MAG: RNA polymerase Rpb4 [Thermoproteota archaeon]|jgi:DNA-directed RNA polymerase subunit F|nr:RNA polymerase Rpb4 [Thermoproteota archaeon]
MTEIIYKEVISLPQVKEILGPVKPDDMDQIQRWTYDYVSKFAKSDSVVAQKMIKQLIEECELKDEEAVEIVNVLPTSLEELRAFSFGWKKLVLTETLEKMQSILQMNTES